MSTPNRLIGFFQKRSVKLSLPFLLLVVGGSFGLKQFTENRYVQKILEISPKKGSDVAAGPKVVTEQLELIRKHELLINFDERQNSFPDLSLFSVLTSNENMLPQHSVLFEFSRNKGKNFKRGTIQPFTKLCHLKIIIQFLLLNKI